MNIKNRIKTILTIALVAMVALAVSAPAATITTSTTAPTVDASDVSNLVSITGDLKWFDDVEHDAGQTFTPVEDSQLNAFTIQLGVGRDNADDQDDWVNVRLGTITRPGGVFTFTDIYSEEADLDGDWFGEDYVTFTFDTPQILVGGVEYGIILDAQEMGDWHQGIPYIALSGNDYADGNAIGRGDPRPDDLVFHADLEGAASTLPEVEAGSDWITWSGAPVTLDDVVVVNNSDPVTDLTYSWTADSADGVVFSATDVESPTVTITKATSNPSVVTLTLAVNNVGSEQIDIVDTMTIEVYDDSCEAALALGTSVAFDTTDFNHDCITNIEDFVEMAKVWLVDYTLTAPQVR